MGDPFREKLLIEACLEVLEAPWLVAMRDLGAAGLTSSTVECASKGAAGSKSTSLASPGGETGMTPYEVMLSESQERMLVVVRRGHEAQAQAVFDRWGLHSDVIGRVTSGERVLIMDGGQTVADLPHALLTDPRCTSGRWRTIASGPSASATWGPSRAPGPGAALLALLGAPNIASKRAVYRRYDQTVQTNTVQAPGGDAPCCA